MCSEGSLAVFWGFWECPRDPRSTPGTPQNTRGAMQIATPPWGTTDLWGYPTLTSETTVPPDEAVRKPPPRPGHKNDENYGARAPQKSSKTDRSGSELVFEAGIGSGIAGNPLGRILRSNGPREELPKLCSRQCSRVFPSAPGWGGGFRTASSGGTVVSEGQGRVTQSGVSQRWGLRFA